MPDVPLAVARTLYSLDLPAPLRIIRAVGDNVPDVRGRPRDLNARLDLHVVPLPSGGCLIPLPLVDQSNHPLVDGKSVAFGGFPAVCGAVIGTVEACGHRPERSRR